MEVGEGTPLTVLEPASLSVGGGDATLSPPRGSLLLRSRPPKVDVDTEVVDIRPGTKVGEATRSLTAPWVLVVSTLRFLLVARLAIEPPLPLRSRPRNAGFSLAAFATAAALVTSMGSVIFGRVGTGGGGGRFAGAYISSKLAKVIPDCPDWYNCRLFLNLSSSRSTVLPLELVLLDISRLVWEAEV